MNFLPEFEKFLFSQSKPSSGITVKNYLSDISRFIRWFEGRFTSFSPELITPEIIKEFKHGNIGAVSSIERSLSSLRKFFNFLVLEGVISESPFKQSNTGITEQSDPYKLKEFKNYLYVYNASKLTIKNYLMDVKAFLKWLAEVTDSKNAWDIKGKDILGKIDNQIIEEYKRRLLASLEPWRSGPYAPRTINRKLSSLRKYLKWAQENGLMNEGVVVAASIVKRKTSIDTGSQTEKRLPKTSVPSYSEFPPIRLVQKTIRGIAFIPEIILINPLSTVIRRIEHLKWQLSGKPIFESIRQRESAKIKIKSLPKEAFAPFAISVSQLPFHRKLIFHLIHTRPNWYKRYHEYSFSHYIHLAILVVIMSAVGFGVYQNLAPRQTQGVLGFANPQIPPRILSFQGRLTDSSDNPITSSTNLRFALYDSLTGTGSALLWQEVNTVTPDSDGIFSVLLGNRSTMQQSLFAERAGLWLGVSVGQTAELTPRQRLATVAYAENADNLQGLPPITQSGAGTTNVVLALDSSGNLTIGGTATPTFQATGGQFTLSGNPLLLTTVSGTNGDIIASPSGLGKIDLNKPIQNLSNNNNISTAVGAVEFDDLVAILATSSGQSALTINQNDAGPLISASSSGTAKFTVSNAGGLTLADDLAVNGGDITSTQTTFNLLNSTVTTLNIGGAATTINLGATTGTTTTANSLTILGNTTLGDTAADTIAFTGSINSNVVPDANNSRNLGSSSLRWNTVYGVNGDFTNISGTITGGSTTSNSWTINSDNATNNAEIDSLAFGAGTAAFNSVLQWNAVNNTGRVVGFDNTNLFNYPIGIFSQVSGANQTFTSGTLFKYGQPAVHAITQSAAFIGSDIDFSSNITVPNTASGNQTGYKTTLKDGGASATAIGFQTAGTLDYGLDIGGTIGTADIRLSNAETISNTTDGTIALGGANLRLDAGKTIDLASAGALNIGDTNGTTLTLGAGGALTRTISIGTGTGADTINIGTGTVTADTISIGGLSTTVLATTGTLTHTGTANINTSGSATTAIGNSTGSLTLASGGTSSWTNTSGNLTIQTATSGTLVLDSAGAINLGNTNATSLSIGRTGVTTTNNGALTSTQTLTASNGLTLTTGALNLTATSGSTSITGYGTTSVTSTTASGNILTLADSSFTTTGANLANLTFTNTNAGAGAVTTNGLSITPTGTAIVGGGSNTLNAINLPNVTAIANNTFNGLNFGTGYTNLINSANFTVTAAGAETIAGNFTQTGATTLSTGTGAVSLNGNTTLGAGKTFTWTTGAIDSTGKLGVGTTGPGAQVEVDTGATTTIGQIIKAQASQTADLLQIQNSLAGVIAKVDSLGNITGNTLTSTVATGTSPLTITSTTLVSNLHVAAADQPQPNLVLNSDFGRRNKWMTFMPETFADTSGYQQIDAGAAPTVSGNVLTFQQTNNEVAWPKAGGYFWRDSRMSLSFKATAGSTTFRLRHYVNATNYVEASVLNGVFTLLKVVGGVSTTLDSIAQTLTANNWYWLEIETQGLGRTGAGTVVAKLYNTNVTTPGTTKAASTLLQTRTGTATDAALDAGAGLDFTSDLSSIGGLSTGDGGVYVEGWGPESYTVAFSGTVGGQAIGFDESTDAGPLGKQWAMRAYIPAASRTISVNGDVANWSTAAPNTTYTNSFYVQTSGKGGTGDLITSRVFERDGTGGAVVTWSPDLADAGETSWTRKTRTTAITTNSATRRLANAIYINLGATATGTVWFDLPQIEQGSVATPWRNAPADDGPITWNITINTSGNATTTSATYAEPVFGGQPGGNPSLNAFIPWDTVVRATFTGGGNNSADGNSTSFDITADGTPMYGGAAVTNLWRFVQRNAASGDIYQFVPSGTGSFAAGKHRFAPRFNASAGTSQIFANPPPQLVIVATRGKFDLAEEYSVADTTIEAGDVVRLAQPTTYNLQPTTLVEKVTKGYDSSILGIVSTAPAVTLGSQVYLNSYQSSPNLRPVALSGRVPVKVTNENGPIHRGDTLTSSEKFPGFAMRATHAGRVIGIAMEEFSPAISDKQQEISTGKIMTFVNLSWYDPDVYLASTGDFVINKVQNPTQVATATPDPQTGLYPNQVSSNSSQVASSSAQPNNVLSSMYQVLGGKPNCAQQVNSSNFGLITSNCPQTKSVDYMYQITDSFGNAVQRVGAFSQLVVGTLKSGLVQTQELIADNITVNNKIISPIADVQTVRTDIITPLSSDKIVIKAKEQSATTSAELGVQPLIEVQNASGSAVATIDDKGVIRGQSLEASSASISGTLDSFGLISKEASISGTLRAKNIVADNLESLTARIASLSGLAASIDKRQTSNDTGPLRQSYSEASIQTQTENLIANIDTLNAQVGTFMQGLFAVGPTSLSDATVFGQLSVGGNLVLADSSINVLGSDLKLQSLGQGGILLGKRVYIDANGDLSVSGNATFKGTLFAGLISPVPGQDLVFNLGDKGNTGTQSAQLLVKNASGSAVLSVNNKGDITSSGSARLQGDLSARQATFSDLLAKTFSIVRNAQADTSLNETVASSSAGFATITAGQTERTIITPFVKENSLIYLTPTSDTQGETPYIARQTVEDLTLGTKASFTIGISQPLDKDIKLNWWVVN